MGRVEAGRADSTPPGPPGSGQEPPVQSSRPCRPPKPRSGSECALPYPFFFY